MSNTTDTVESWIQKLFNPGSNTDEQIRDPDKGEEAWDIWLQSRCGRSSETITVSEADMSGLHALGEWTGRMCVLACIQLHACRVGSTEIKTYDGPIELLPIVPGARMFVQNLKPRNG
jgi:hypothetical protein